MLIKKFVFTLFYYYFQYLHQKNKYSQKIKTGYNYPTQFFETRKLSKNY